MAYSLKNPPRLVVEEPSVNKKRCSLPTGMQQPQSLYQQHHLLQQRRLSERGLMIYKPNKPDIDLIKNFHLNKEQGNPQNRRNSSSICVEGKNERRRRASHGTFSAQEMNGRKVQIRINADTHVQILPNNEQEVNAEQNEYLSKPVEMHRRFSDSSVIGAPLISITPADKWRRSSAGIVCSTGELINLKCLTSSAQEITFPTDTTIDDDVNQQRSHSFDASLFQKKSSWFSRRHSPISVKLGQPINKLQPNTPILTVTSENEVSSELIPSPPAVTPISTGNRSPFQDKAGDEQLEWDNNKGYVLDAAVLGLAIENHLKKSDKRRATFATLYQPHHSSVMSKVTIPPGRPRSASYYSVVPLVKSDVVGVRRESISTFVSSKVDEESDSDEEQPLLQTTTTTGSFIRTNVTSDFGQDQVINEEEDEDFENNLFITEGVNSGGVNLGDVNLGSAERGATGWASRSNRFKRRGDSICSAIRDFITSSFSKF